MPLTTYATLFTAILLEVIGTTCLQRSQQFTQIVPTVLMGLCYAGSFYFLSLALRSLPTGLVYAVWSGVGVVLVATIAWVFQSQKLDAAALCGIGLIVSGVVVMNLSSSASPH